MTSILSHQQFTFTLMLNYSLCNILLQQSMLNTISQRYERLRFLCQKTFIKYSQPIILLWSRVFLARKVVLFLLIYRFVYCRSRDSFSCMLCWFLWFLFTLFLLCRNLLFLWFRFRGFVILWILYNIILWSFESQWGYLFSWHSIIFSIVYNFFIKKYFLKLIKPDIYKLKKVLDKMIYFQKHLSICLFLKEFIKKGKMKRILENWH